MKIDLMSISGHKLYGPKGVGALYVRRRPRVRLVPLIDGGGQERGLRSGTLPTPLCVGLGRAAALAAAEMAEEARRLRRLRDRLHAGLGAPDSRARRSTAIPSAACPATSISVPGHRRRRPDRGLPGDRDLDRLGLHLGRGRAVLRAARARPVRRAWPTPRSASASAASPPRPRSISRSMRSPPRRPGCETSKPANP